MARATAGCGTAAGAAQGRPGGDTQQSTLRHEGTADPLREPREARGGRGGFRSVAIVPSARRVAAPTSAGRVVPLRLLTPRGFIVEGLEPELLVSLLRVLG